MLTLDMQGGSNRDGERRQEAGTGREREKHRNSKRKPYRERQTQKDKMRGVERHRD